MRQPSSLRAGLIGTSTPAQAMQCTDAGPRGFRACSSRPRSTCLLGGPGSLTDRLKLLLTYVIANCGHPTGPASPARPLHLWRASPVALNALPTHCQQVSVIRAINRSLASPSIARGWCRAASLRLPCKRSPCCATHKRTGKLGRSGTGQPSTALAAAHPPLVAHPPLERASPAAGAPRRHGDVFGGDAGQGADGQNLH